ncbi:cation:proton antiporter [Luoshenia tenuis]|jgi:Kef-type K+ transport system membrane component KefB|uniref:cation:proton antiporter n=1 Tax=Luoshenia tenuis TaxID=2763654 RepID=UPI003D914EC4
MIFESWHLSQHTLVVVCLAAILLAAFFMTRLTKKLRLPNVTGYILAGVFIGPCMLSLIPQAAIDNMDFVTDIALSFIAFSVGKYLRWDNLKKNGSHVLIITLFEALVAAAVVTVTMIAVFRLPVSFALLLGAIASATAPASTIMTLRQYHAKGQFVDILLAVVALDDVVALVAFSACAAVAQGLAGEGFSLATVLEPILLNFAAIGLGGLLGYALHKVIDANHTKDTRLMVAVAMILVVTGFCSALDLSPLLACMALGAVYINAGKQQEIFSQVDTFAVPVLAIFFVLSGMRLDLTALSSAGVIGIAYFLVRILGKYAGCFAGAALSRAPKAVRNFMGLGLIPQAGVAIGLALLAQRILPAETGGLLSTIILSSSVLYEMIGPACAKGSLFLAHVIPRAEKTGPAGLPLPPRQPRKARAPHHGHKFALGAKR